MHFLKPVLWLSLCLMGCLASGAERGDRATRSRKVRVDQITRGPYLQCGTANSMVVRWRTDKADTSVVRYGEALTNLNLKATSTGVATEHVVLLSGLKTNMQYFYAIGTTNLILGGSNGGHFFFTSPAPGTPQLTRIWALGDAGTRTTNQANVRNAFYQFTGPTNTDVILLLGDNAYSAGTDKEYQGAIFDMYEKQLRTSVLWPTLGNHDGGSANSETQSGVYYDIFTLPTRGQAGGLPSGTEAYYSFDYGNIHFICLDSHDTDRSTNGLMLTWLKNDLAANARDWIIAYWHHPPYSKGSHNSDDAKDSGGRLKEMRENALPLLEAGGVDLVLSGHSHNYERSYLIDGHYDTSDKLQPSMFKSKSDGRPDGRGAYVKPEQGPVPHAGAIYTVAGSAGHLGRGALNHPIMFVSLRVLGSLVVDVNGSRLDGTFLDDQGARRDYFSIVK